MSTAVANQKQPYRAAAAAFIGTAIEWYDFYIYGFASAIIFGPLFFSTESTFVAMMASFATFAIGLLARPFGGMFFGHLGDVLGRKRALVATLYIMGAATVGVGCLPTYAQAGVFAPALLVTLRIFQGLAVGGNWGGAVLMAAEHAPEGRRAFYASFAQLGSPAGLILATLAFTGISALPEENLYSWGWRLPFLASFVLLFVGQFVRKAVNESPEFTESLEKDDKDKVKLPVKEVLTKIPKLLLLTIGANCLGIAGFYFTNTFMLAYTTTYLGLAKNVILNALFWVAVIQFFSMPINALLGERLGVRGYLLFTTGACIFCPYLMFTLVDTGSVAMITLGVGTTIFFIGGCYALIAGYVTSLFPTRLRYSGISMAYQFSGAIFGALTPLVGTALAEKASGDWMPLAIFFSIISTISFLSLYFINPKKYKDHQ